MLKSKTKIDLHSSNNCNNCRFAKVFISDETRSEFKKCTFNCDAKCEACDDKLLCDEYSPVITKDTICRFYSWAKDLIATMRLCFDCAHIKNDGEKLYNCGRLDIIVSHPGTYRLCAFYTPKPKGT